MNTATLIKEAGRAITVRAWPKVTARIGADGRTFRVVGREAETLLAMLRNGPRGVSGWDFPGGPPYRLAAYVKDLRHIGLSIRTDRENHRGGWHGKYVLESPVTIIAVATANGDGHE